MNHCPDHETSGCEKEYIHISIYRKKQREVSKKSRTKSNIRIEGKKKK